MKLNKVIIVLGEPNSIFSEILFKYFKSKNFKNIKQKLILIGCKSLLEEQMKILNFNFKLNEIEKIKDCKKKMINIINVDYKYKKAFSKIDSSSNSYIENCFRTSLKVIKKKKNIALLNGPISKKHFLKKKFLGITEYLKNKTKSSKSTMLIYNKKFSVSPLTTHIPINKVSKNISKQKIVENVNQINNFYLKKIKKKPKMAILGLNPHCESVDKRSEESKYIIPAIKILKKKRVTIDGPFSTDTFFIKENIKKYDVTIGMYHDQVLTPFKTLFKFNAINVTCGLPFIRVSPDHGPNSKMLGKNKSDPSSIFYAMNFFQSIK